MADLFSDAFAADRVQTKVFGMDVTDTDAIIASEMQAEIPESKCNSVAFMKSEATMTSCRNLLAVCETYICYSVKKNLLRVIQTVSTQKTLLRGHEYPVIDIKFSPVDRNLVCSIDDVPEGGDASKARINIWQLKDSPNELTHEAMATFAFGATIVQPHPLLASVWAVAKGARLGIISVAMGTGNVGETTYTSFDTLPLHTSFTSGSISGLSFSDDGRCIAVSLSVSSGASSGIAVWNLPSFDILTSGKGSMDPRPCWTRFSNNLSPKTVSLVFLPQGILTASCQNASNYSGNAAEKDVKEVLLQLFPFKSSDASLLTTQTTMSSVAAMQTLHIRFPVHPNSTSAEGTANENLEIAMNNGCSKEAKFVVLLHRRSHYVACLAVNRGNWDRQPIYHVTFVDLKWPVCSLDCTTIAGRDHHSDEEVEHLEVSCYQEQDGGQSAVHQYHIPSGSLCNPNAYVPTTSSSKSNVGNGGNDINAVDLGGLLPIGMTGGTGTGGLSILNMLNASATTTTTTESLSTSSGLGSGLGLGLDSTEDSSQSGLGNGPSTNFGQSLLSMLNTSSTLSLNQDPSFHDTSAPRLSSPVGTHTPIQRPPSASISSTPVVAPMESKDIVTSVSLEDLHTLPPLPDILPTGNGVQGRSIMSMLNKKVTAPPPLGKTASAQASPALSSLPTPPATITTLASSGSTSASSPPPIALIPLPLPMPAVAVIPPPSSIQETHTPVASTSSSSGVIASDAVVASSTPVVPPVTPPPAASTGFSVLGLLLSGMQKQTPAPSPAPITTQSSATVSTPVSVAVVSDPTNVSCPVPQTIDEQGERKEETKPMAAVAKAMPTKPTSIPASKEVSTASSSSTAVDSRSAALSFLHPVGGYVDEHEQDRHSNLLLSERVNDLTRAVLAVVETVTEIRSDLSSSNALNRVPTAVGGSGSATDANGSNAIAHTEGMTRETMNDLKKDMIREVQKISNQISTLISSNTQNLKAQIDTQTQKSSQGMATLTQTLTTAMKTLIDTEVKKQVEVALRNKQWRDELVAHMTQSVSQSMQTEMIPVISNKVHTSVKDTVRDTVKTSLASSFRTAFESSLLPAFQIGTDRMFAQVQASFDQGMEGLAEQARRSQEYSDECAKCTIDLSREVSALRATVAGLEAKIALLTASGGRWDGLSGTDSAGGANAPALSDPVMLLEKGRVSEAVECALEWKDSDKLVALLERMTPNQLLQNCNRLVQLCTAQQLAGDLTAKDPQEGLSKRLEWLKNLVMGLLFASATDTVKDDSANQYLAPVLSGMTASLQQTETRLVSKITEFRAAGDEVKCGPYAAAITDLRMLMALVSSSRA